MNEIDLVQLNFNPAAKEALKWTVAFIMFGVALDLKTEDFRRLFQAPKAPAIGLFCQFILMPAVAWGITILLKIPASISLGVILIAACPGGNLSNFLTSLSQGNAAVSVSMSAVSTLASIIMTPFNLAFWGSLHPSAAPLLREISISPADIFEQVLIILLIPTFIGMFTARQLPDIAAKLKAPMRYLSMLIFLGFVAGAFAVNWDKFLQLIGHIFGIIAVVNLTGFALGYGTARFLRLPHYDAKAVCFETGIQNSGFGMLLVWQFFDGLGGMLVAAAWWGIWHIVAGMTLALIFRRMTEHSAPAT